MQLKEWSEIQRVLPPLNTQEINALRRSIRQDGIRQEISVFPDGRIIDGHHRFAIGQELEIDIPYKIVGDLTETKAIALGVVLNWARRQISKEQWTSYLNEAKAHSGLTKEIVAQLREQGYTQAEVAKKVGVPQNTISSWEAGHIINTDNVSHAAPDYRIKIPTSESYVIHDRYKTGEKPSKIATDYKVSKRTINRRIAKVDREIEKAAEEQARRAQFPQPENVKLIHRAIENLTESDIIPGSVDIIITDPPYPKEYLSLYKTLAEQAKWILKPGGYLLAMAGQSYLPEIMKLMTPHLTYHWTISYGTPGGQSPQIWPRNINTFWKPVLWFTNGKFESPDWYGDVIKSKENDKRFHEWGQSESGIGSLVEKYSKPDDLILDPFVGGGTTAVVCVALNRAFIGSDVDNEKIETTRDRIYGKERTNT